MSARKVWLLYEQGDSRDGGDTPLLVFSSQADADAAVLLLRSKVESVRKRLARMSDPWEDGISEDEYGRRDARRDAFLKAVRWPFGLRREHWGWDFTVAVQPLPYIEAKS